MQTKRVVMYNSPEAAVPVIIGAWKAIDGKIYTSESSARYMSHTHKVCECGKTMERGYTACKWCRYENTIKRYNALPEIVWDGKSPLTIYNDDRYFFNLEDLLEYAEDNETDVE